MGTVGIAIAPPVAVTDGVATVAKAAPKLLKGRNERDAKIADVKVAKI